MLNFDRHCPGLQLGGSKSEILGAQVEDLGAHALYISHEYDEVWS